MNTRMIAHLLGIILLIEAVLLLFPMAVALIYGESPMPFLLTDGIILALCLPFSLRKPRNNRIYAKDGFVCVAAAWILLGAFGALPFVFSGAIPNYISAFFETVSGLTTTGASILTEIESLPRGILFWRSFTHWIGGMGVLVFMLAILPLAGGQTMHLMRAICLDSHIDADMLITAYPECAGDTVMLQNRQKKPRKAHTGHKNRHRHRSHKKPNINAQARTEGESK